MEVGKRLSSLSGPGGRRCLEACSPSTSRPLRTRRASRTWRLACSKVCAVVTRSWRTRKAASRTVMAYGISFVTGRSATASHLLRVVLRRAGSATGGALASSSLDESLGASASPGSGTASLSVSAMPADDSVSRLGQTKTSSERGGPCALDRGLPPSLSLVSVSSVNSSRPSAPESMHAPACASGSASGEGGVGRRPGHLPGSWCTLARVAEKS